MCNASSLACERGKQAQAAQGELGASCTAAACSLGAVEGQALSWLRPKCTCDLLRDQQATAKQAVHTRLFSSRGPPSGSILMFLCLQKV